MYIELDRKGLEILVEGSRPHYNNFEHHLIKKAGHEYSPQYGTTTWRHLNALTEDELLLVYLICRIKEC